MTRAGVEPAFSWLRARRGNHCSNAPCLNLSSESQVRTDGLRLMRAPLWPAELSRHSCSFVRSEGLEPSRLSAPASEAGVSTEFPPQAHASGRAELQPHVRSAGFEPAASSISGWPLYLPVVRARGAAARCRPGPPDVRDRSRSRARRHRCPPWIRTTIGAFRARRPAGWTNGHRRSRRGET